jgi:urate oxidase
MKHYNLEATLQKSYYGKAKVFYDDKFIVLKSYNTHVIAIDKQKNTIVRLWSGYSKTTMNHINDFLLQYGFNKISKNEWLQLPCVNEKRVFNVYISNGFYNHKSTALLTEDEAQKEVEKIISRGTRAFVWYE